MSRNTVRPGLGINWDFIPVSHATNSYDLLTDVIAAIREEPKRIYMDEYVRSAQAIELDEMEAPACGTQGCIAGWVMYLKCDRRKAQANEMGGIGIFNLSGQGVSTFAESLMPEAIEMPWFSLTMGDAPYEWPREEYDSIAYAEGVIANIEKFQATYGRELRANVLEA